MPNTPSSTAITMTAMRRRRQKPTNWSIIEQDSALDDHLLAGLYAGADCDLRALFEERLDGAALEGPRRGRDEHAGAVVIHEQRRARQHDPAHGSAVQPHRREHVRLQVGVGVLEGDARLVAPRIRLD